MRRGYALLAGIAGALAIASAVPTWADTPRGVQHRIVLEMTSDDPEVWTAVLNNIENVRTSLGSVSVELVTHGKGLQMLETAKNGAVSARMTQNAEKGVIFAACENSMKRKGVSKEALVSFAHTVDSGVAEVVRKQEAGWSYLRVGL